MKKIKDILVIDDYGSIVRKKRKRILVINVKKGTKEEIPIKDIREVVILTKTSISTEVIKFLVDNGVGITICSYLGKPVARIVSSKIGGTSMNRKLQYRAAEGKLGVILVKELLRAKLEGQRTNMRYYAKSKRIEAYSRIFMEASDKIDRLITHLKQIDAEKLDDVRGTLLNIEGQAAAVYWDSIAKVYGKEFGFSKRDRSSRDVINTFLNIGYHITSIWIWKYLLYFSLDPYEGFLHVERPGRLSFVFDVIEPVRPIVDRIVIGYVLKNKPVVSFQSCRKFKLFMLEQIVNYKVFIGCRKMSLKTALFYYIQSIVSFLREGKEMKIPKIYW